MGLAKIETWLGCISPFCRSLAVSSFKEKIQEILLENPTPWGFVGVLLHIQTLKLSGNIHISWRNLIFSETVPTIFILKSFSEHGIWYRHVSSQHWFFLSSHLSIFQTSQKKNFNHVISWHGTHHHLPERPSFTRRCALCIIAVAGFGHLEGTAVSCAAKRTWTQQLEPQIEHVIIPRLVGGRVTPFRTSSNWANTFLPRFGTLVCQLRCE